MSFIVLQIFSLARDWSKRVTWLNMPHLNLGNIRVICPNFQNCTCCENCLKDNKHSSLHLAWRYDQIFVLGHYLFLEAHSFPRATLSENCSHLGTDYIRQQISVHNFAPNGGYCFYILRGDSAPAIRRLIASVSLCTTAACSVCCWCVSNLQLVIQNSV